MQLLYRPMSYRMVKLHENRVFYVKDRKYIFVALFRPRRIAKHWENLSCFTISSSYSASLTGGLLSSQPSGP